MIYDYTGFTNIPNPRLINFTGGWSWTTKEQNGVATYSDGTIKKGTWKNSLLINGTHESPDGDILATYSLGAKNTLK